MIVLYWLDAAILPQGLLAATVKYEPVKGFALIVAMTCIGSYGAALAHQWLNENVIKRVLLGKSGRNGGLSAVDVKPKYF